MAVSEQIIHQNSQTMNVKTMLADFLSFVTPKMYAQSPVFSCGGGNTKLDAEWGWLVSRYHSNIYAVAGIAILVELFLPLWFSLL
ncbi:hypothetical protein [Rheinheimera pleomorphica]|uniref:hypothetical protein n=1 Tax=Rheinheimera pleomorphica TaxID=2703963 RepID=UPI00141E5020|nr:hypothetical protein [Rheinheimera pleomorphica]